MDAILCKLLNGLGQKVSLKCRFIGAWSDPDLLAALGVVQLCRNGHCFMIAHLWLVTLSKIFQPKPQAAES